MSVTQRRKAAPKQQLQDVFSSDSTQEAMRLTDSAYTKLVEHWIFCAIVKLGAHREMIKTYSIDDAEVFQVIGLGNICQLETDGNYSQQKAQKHLAMRYKEVVGTIPDIPEGRVLESNLSWIARRLGLSMAEVDVLRFMVFTQECECLNTVMGNLDNMTVLGVIRTLSVLLEIPDDQIAETIRADGALINCGLLTIDYSSRQRFSSKIELLSGISEQLFSVHADPMLMLRERVVPGQRPKLTVADYPHLTDDIGMLRRYFTNTVGCEGKNVLVYGSPGTGKTELVRTLSQAMGFDLYEVATKQDDSTPLSGNGRLSAYRLAQQMLRQESETIILFDEVEDAFEQTEETYGFPFRPKAQCKKAWFNQLLETNPVPAFWLSNAIHAIDHAIIRRFDYVLRLETPPRSVRETIIRRYFDQVPVSQQWIGQLAEHETLAPAIVERAAKVAITLVDLPPEDVERVSIKIMKGTLEAMNLPSLKLPSKTAEPRYRPECVNTDPPVHEVAAKLAQFGQGRLCLYGPPGTGKTAYGRYLAERLERRLIVKRASDILGCYVGETEKQIAAMFAEAASENAVLLLDEADSFLQSREKAVRSWEVTQVNEMLTQMEQFDGIFIASTNLMSSLDEATLRRFDLKVKFRWLEPEQIRHLFEDCLDQMAIPHESLWLERTQQINTLTPGDFANVLRQSRLRGIGNAKALHEALLAEAKARPRSGDAQRIGF